MPSRFGKSILSICSDAKRNYIGTQFSLAGNKAESRQIEILASVDFRSNE